MVTVDLYLLYSDKAVWIIRLYLSLSDNHLIFKKSLVKNIVMYVNTLNIYNVINPQLNKEKKCTN